MESLFTVESLEYLISNDEIAAKPKILNEYPHNPSGAINLIVSDKIPT